jgi:FkbM family methyltransferase
MVGWERVLLHTNFGGFDLLRIVDIGARYGIFPSFQTLADCAEFYMYEPDNGEASRLSAKYQSNKNVHIKNYALNSEEGYFDLNISAHKGLTSFLVKSEDFYNSHSYMEQDIEIVETQKVFASTLNQEFEAKSVDYIKIDTEGTELKILEGGDHILDDALGLVVEISFHKIRQEQPMFGDFQNFLEKFNFELLNMNYNGRGASVSEFSMPDKYGWLLGADCVFVKNIEVVRNRFKKDKDVGVLAKYVLFFLINNASDVGVKYLLDFIQEFDIKFYEYDSALVSAIQKNIDKLFKDLQYLPYCDIKKLQATYYTIFNKPMKIRHEYFENL